MPDAVHLPVCRRPGPSGPQHMMESDGEGVAEEGQEVSGRAGSRAGLNASSCPAGLG